MAFFISPASDIGKNPFVGYAKCATVSRKFAFVEITLNAVAYNEGKSFIYTISHSYTTICLYYTRRTLTGDKFAFHEPDFKTV